MLKIEEKKLVKESLDESLKKFENMGGPRRPIEEIIYWLCRLASVREAPQSEYREKPKQNVREGERMSPLAFWEKTHILSGGTLTRFLRENKNMLEICAEKVGKRYFVYDISTIKFLCHCNSPSIQRRAKEYLSKISLEEIPLCAM